jgi:hypothetical protein
MWTLAFGHHEDRTPTHGLPLPRARPPSPTKDGGILRTIRDACDLYIWRELAPLTARACLPETWDNEQAVVATNALLRQYPELAFHMR